MGPVGAPGLRPKFRVDAYGHGRVSYSCCATTDPQMEAEVISDDPPPPSVGLPGYCTQRKLREGGKASHIPAGLKNQGFGLRLGYVYLLPITPIPVPL